MHVKAQRNSQSRSVSAAGLCYVPLFEGRHSRERSLARRQRRETRRRELLRLPSEVVSQWRLRKCAQVLASLKAVEGVGRESVGEGGGTESVTASSASTGAVTASVPQDLAGKLRASLQGPQGTLVAGGFLTVVGAALSLLVLLQTSWRDRLASSVGGLPGAVSSAVCHVHGSRRDALTLLTSAAAMTVVMNKLRISKEVGFMLGGALLGPHGLSVLSEVHGLEELAEIGIEFFLFEMGLELSLETLFGPMRNDVLLGASQVGLTALIAMALLSLPFLHSAGLSPAARVVIGGSMALSSSAFVLQLLRNRDELSTRYGRASLGVLLFQDLAVVPLLVVIQILGQGGSGLAYALALAGAKGVAALGTIYVLGKRILDPLLTRVAASASQEAFIAAVLSVVLFTATATETVGLSNTLGAFLAGVLISETKFKYQVGAAVGPFRGLGLGLFFFSMGFVIDPFFIRQSLGPVLKSLTALVTGKALVTFYLGLCFGLNKLQAAKTGLILAQGGEFAFVALGLAQRLGIMGGEVSRVLLTATALSMMLTPFLADAVETVKGLVKRGSVKETEKQKQKEEQMAGPEEDPEMAEITARPEGYVAVVGYGRVGRTVCGMLGKKLIKHVAFDNNADTAEGQRAKGQPVWFGDARSPLLFSLMKIENARAVVFTIDDTRATEGALRTLRKARPDLPIFVRAKNKAQAARFRSKFGVESFVPTLHSEELAAAVLRQLGIGTEEVLGIVEEERRKAFAEQLALTEEYALVKGTSVQPAPNSLDVDPQELPIL
uniref:Uncharacterized protein n=1 Tax=Chromera velia CCMP2878 TaxID=1169474 RepID=A0A0G4FE38_9ALVE|eukprot:Cvel_16549.t1-p1 / transcript=Cvel_16549.t1 / gene=Cvel_16549 / organism=Chromera_velia_CCMP2878 / gene_product=K( ) efflux antiporter 1, chloroplastic, putative / transcript_product=K( ) efflux antiporter 1, chloroplastic, putative / location=Cvel_scaffold1279:37962-46251(-) / protein_length=778 / sequence_SO=supercontig / SO=protein_coding / is_pseudo=false